MGRLVGICFTSSKNIKNRKNFFFGMKDTKTAKEIIFLQLNILKQQIFHLAMTHAKNSKNTFFCNKTY